MLLFRALTIRTTFGDTVTYADRIESRQCMCVGKRTRSPRIFHESSSPRHHHPFPRSRFSLFSPDYFADDPRNRPALQPRRRDSNLGETFDIMRRRPRKNLGHQKNGTLSRIHPGIVCCAPESLARLNEESV
nr:hypothetical protein CFP56_26085 [Quercus suber]